MQVPAWLWVIAPVGAIVSSRGVARLSTGASLPYVTMADEKAAGGRVLCVHGTFHDLRCYEEHWLPYFAAHGLEATAVSLRGTAESEVEGARASGRIKLSDHVADMEAFLSEAVPPGHAIVAHSFGGPIAMELVRARRDLVAGAALACSVPPSGNAAMTWRTVRRSPCEAVLITRGFALKTAASNADDARRLFFAPDDPADDDLLRYVSWFADNANSSLDLADFARHLPSRFAGPTGRASFLDDDDTLPRLVIGADCDAIVDAVGVRETAEFMGLDHPRFLSGVPHDIMLGSTWRQGADAILQWLRDERLLATR